MGNKWINGIMGVVVGDALGDAVQFMSRDEAIEHEGISEDDAVKGVIKVASLTHNHLRTNMCNAMYFYMVKSILDAKNKDEVRPLIDILQEGVNNALKYFDKDEANHKEMTRVGRLFDLSEMKKLPSDDIQSSGYVIHTIEAAVWSLITTESFRDALLKAVNLGDDSDTVGAVTAGLAGLYYGYESIPKDWLSTIQKREWIEKLCNTRAASGRFNTSIPMRPVDINEIKFVNRPL